eukprot:Awhi_evm1s2068
MSDKPKPTPPFPILQVNEFFQYICFQLPGGRDFIRLGMMINFTKSLSFLVYPYLLYYHENESTLVALKLLAVMQTFYCTVWILKDVYYGDPAWRQTTSVLGAIGFLVLFGAVFYFPVYCLVTETCYGPKFAIDNLGNTIYLSTWIRPRSLITEGLHTSCRNPNYYGEYLIYLGFCGMSGSFICFVSLNAFWIFLFSRIITKDYGLSRYDTFQAWSDRASIFFPNLQTI